MAVNNIVTVNCAIILVTMVLSFASGLPQSFKKNGYCEECVCGVRGRNDRIVGGEETSVHEYPWLVALVKQGKVYCGGSLISSRHILTAAHCVNGFDASEIRIYLGGHKIRKDHKEVRRVDAIYEHEDFDIVTFNNDLAVLEMDAPVEFGPAIQPACLPSDDNSDYAGALTVIAGWGRQDEKHQQISDAVRHVVVPVWTTEQCLDSGYGNKRITENMMCAGFHDGGRDACQGDSGGPMHMEGATGSMEIIGIVSWGRGCARPELPGIYTKVVNYLDWIHGKMSNECLCDPKRGKWTNYLQKLLRNASV